MAISPLAPTTGTTSGSFADASATGTGSSDMDRDTFLRLLVTQLSNQDPLSPTDPTEFVSQLAQFTSLEQMAGMRAASEASLLSQTAATNAQVVNLVGREVTFSDDRITWSGAGTESMNFDLDKSAANVDVEIRNSSGVLVRTEPLGALKSGSHAAIFDGMDDDLRTLPPGDYTFKVKAVDALGDPIAVSTEVTAQVTAVSFKEGYPQLLVDSGQTLLLGQVLSVREGSGNDGTPNSPTAPGGPSNPGSTPTGGSGPTFAPNLDPRNMNDPSAPAFEREPAPSFVPAPYRWPTPTPE